MIFIKKYLKNENLFKCIYWKKRKKKKKKKKKKKVTILVKEKNNLLSMAIS